MSLGLVEAIERYRTEQRNSFDRFKEEVYLNLEKSCRKWGFNFHSTKEDWYIDFTKKHKHQSTSFDSKYVLATLEPKLFVALEMKEQYGKPLGCFLNKIEMREREYDWVIIRIDGNKPIKIIVSISDSDLQMYFGTQDIQYFGWIPRQVAFAIPDGSIEYLPEIRRVVPL